MPLSAQPLHPLFGAEVSGIDLRPEIAAQDLADFIRAMDTYAVCVMNAARNIVFYKGFSAAWKPGSKASSFRTLRTSSPAAVALTTVSPT